MKVKKIYAMAWSGVLRFSWGKVAVALVIILASLQVLHLALLSRLENRNNALQKEKQMFNLKKKADKLYASMRSAIKTRQVVDSSGVYQIVNFIYSPDSKDDSSDTVTLVTQCSVDHIYHLVNLVERWTGPVSLAMFAPGRHLSITMEAVTLLYQCLPPFRQNISVHLVYPLVHVPSLIPSSPPTSVPDCQDLRSKLQNILTTNHNYAISGVKYPNNLLRNVALQHAQTDFVMVTDIDMMPSHGLQQAFTAFSHKYSLTTNSSKIGANTVLIVPAFEILPHLSVPKDKASLLDLWKQGSLRPFYHELCWRCQRQTDYETWRNLSLIPSQAIPEIKVAYEVEWKDPWEPFYIGPKNVPKYDERFKQYGFNRISQVIKYQSI